MKIAILGTGALGIALAKTIFENKEVEISMWTKFEEEKELVEKTRGNEKLIPGVKLPNEIEITTDFKKAVENSSIILNCLPFVAVRETANSLKEVYSGQHICSTTKGIDMETFETTTQIFEKTLSSDKVCALSGPSFAIEIANYCNISFVLAGKNEDTLNTVYDLLLMDNICIDKLIDSVGIQICGAVKNAVAIGSGILHGINAADSCIAAYFTRGIKDITEVILSLGGNKETVFTYAGIGDLLLTCTSEKSRNFTFGKLLGEGYSVEQITAKLGGKTVEGVKVINALYNYMKENNLNLNTIPKLYDILFNKKDISIISKL